ncbi:TrbI F-type domain-containing protein [Sphingopyxis terrae]|uniref:TrbI F-type domain-containing protein n=1 Tax=Sphingopyxis terrae TaxID=33052 RepID=UPI000787671A|nr:TrbI F-type domain-containing protein [Sphingopyxis terrae]
MADQPQLDLPPPAPMTPAAKRGVGFGGFTRAQILAGVLLIAVIVWGMWVTRTLTAPKQDHIVAARLSALVGEYVEAQRFSGSPPDRVRVEMQAFMSSLDKELQRRSANGQVVLVGEAVLTKNVPDITDSLKKAVFASGVPEPKRLSAEELQRMQELSAAQAAIASARQATPTTTGAIDPMAAIPTMAPQILNGPAIAPQPTPLPAPGASVSTFGGPDGSGAQ